MTFVESSFKKAKALTKAGKFAEARAVYAAVMEKYPNNQRAREGFRLVEGPFIGQKRGLTPDEKNTLFKAINERRFNDAHALVQKCIQSAGPSVFIYNILGIIFDRTGDQKRAAAHYEIAVKLRPDDPEILGNYGQCLRVAGQYDLAKETLERALTYDPNSAQAHNNLGNVLREMGEAERAIECFKKTAELTPKAPQPLSNIANVLREVGDKPAAKQYYKAALKVAPHSGEILRNLAMLDASKPEDPLFEDLEAALEHHADNAHEQMHIRFALAKAKDDINDYDAAFEEFKAANDIGLEQSLYSKKRHDKTFSGIKKSFEKVTVLSDAETETLPSRPIFILGMPRSGTSLVEQIISSHSDVYGGGELPHLAHATAPVFTSLTNGEPPETETWQQVRNSFFQRLDKELEQPVFTDKMPMNFRFIGFILSAIPEAKIIHTKRDAMAVCWSIYRHLFPSKGIDYQWSLDALGHYYNHYVDLMNFWEKKFPDQIYTVDYEKLTEDQEAETLKLIQACDLEWQDSCLNFHENDRSVRTASTHQVRKPMYQASSKAWLNYEAKLKPLKEALSAPV